MSAWVRGGVVELAGSVEVAGLVEVIGVVEVISAAELAGVLLGIRSESEGVFEVVSEDVTIVVFGFV